tara:strand:+ start:303 stop:848 length:546 start_codon:yes stop_codon:yes gene_type:complete
MTFATTALIVAAVGTVGNIVSGEKSRQAQRKATRNQEGVRRAQQAREQMKAVREQRIAQAQIVQGAATGGTSRSSAAQGGYSAVGSLTAGNLQFGNQMDFFQTKIAGNMNKASQYSGQASMFGSVANLAMMGSSLANTSPATPAASSGSGYGVQGGMSGSNASHVSSGVFSNPLPPSPFGG